MIKQKNDLVPFIQTQLENNQIFELLSGFCTWLRRSQPKERASHLAFLLKQLRADSVLTEQLAIGLCRWLCETRLYPLLVSSGILPREGFGREFRFRLYEKINPSFKDSRDLRDVFFLLFNDKKDSAWLEDIPRYYWDALLGILRRALSKQDKDRLNTHLHNEGQLAIKMLSIWIAAEDLEPELMRLDPRLLDADSPFVALQREVSGWLLAQQKGEFYDDSHLQVMFSQSEELIESLKKKTTTMGSSLGVAYLLERLKQSLQRLAVLMQVFGGNRFLPRRILLLVGDLAVESANRHSVSALWKQSVKMLSRSITQHSGDHGEHYIARDKKAYFSMFYSAAGGGVLIALMALLKIYLGELIEDKTWKGIAAGLNYSLGFTLIFMLHFTVATKQPAMTAALFAEAVEKNPQGRAVNMKLATLLIEVFRSQTVAVLGNVLMAVGVAAVIALGFQAYFAEPLLNSSQIEEQLTSIHPFGATLWYAAIAGVWLFCAGIISGYFDNRCNYLNMRMRLQHHPLLKMWLSEPRREKLGNYLHENYGSIMGNLCFGMLLGLTGVVGYWLDLPLDIRHVAFSSANVGYATVSGDLGWAIFSQSLLFALLIGIVNLIVSFSLTLWIALRSLDAEIDSWRNIWKAVVQQLKQRPLSLFFP